MKTNFEKGITLVSLVVTIIVLIILATVSINIIIGQDGIITKAKQAAQNMEIATHQEQERLNELSGYLSGENIEGGATYDKIAELNEKYNTLKEQYDALSTEYTNFKTIIAQAITDKGIETSVADSSETIASNIRSLSSLSGYDILYQSSPVSQGGAIFNNTFTATHNGKMILHLSNNQDYGERLITVKLNDNVIYSLPTVDVMVDVKEGDQINISFFYGIASLLVLNCY